MKYSNFEDFMNTNIRFRRTFLLPFMWQLFCTNVVVIVCVNDFLCTVLFCSLLFVTLNMKYSNFEDFMNTNIRFRRVSMAKASEEIALQKFRLFPDAVAIYVHYKYTFINDSLELFHTSTCLWTFRATMA